MDEKIEVVISGIGGKFPECENVAELTELLFQKKCGITLDPKFKSSDEPDPLFAIGRLKDVNLFDSLFFQIHRKLCESLDCLTRLSMERAVEAIIDAGISPNELQGTNTAVLMSSTISESEFFSVFDSKTSGFGILGHNRAMQANRVSYSLNLNGPSYSMDCGWVGGLQSLQLAKTMIEKGQIKAALVGVCNLIFQSVISVQFDNMGRLSHSCKTKSFSSDADGYNRAEGCVVFLLQRADEARRSYGTLVSTETMFFGEKDDAFTSDVGPNFWKLLERVYSKSGVDPTSIGFVEAEGSACKKIDTMELNVMADFFCKKEQTEPLLVGSIKSNVGHTEAASALVSIVKGIIAFETGFIPPNINYNSPNEDVPALVDNKIKVVREKTPLPSDLVGITSMGLCGFYGHTILKQNPRQKKQLYLPNEMFHDDLPRLLLLSGRNEEGVQKILKIVESTPPDEEYVALIHKVFRMNIFNYNFRTYTIIPRIKEDYEIHYLSAIEKRPVWFVFSGMGSQWHGMGTQLMTLPIFANTIEKLHNILKKKKVDLKHILTSSDPKLFDNILNSFVGIAAIQIGLVDILNALQIVPDGIIGHSVGELGCAYADGCFTAEEMILSAYARGRASIETELINGKMAAIGKGYQEIKDLLPPNIEVACHNSTSSCTLSGPAEDIEKYVQKLVDEGVFAKAVNVSNIAYHSRYIAPAAPKLLKYLKEVITNPKPRSSRWVSSSIPENEWDSPLAATSSPEYHTNNLLSAVFFEEASTKIPKNAIVIEIAPHGLLQAILKRSLAENCSNIPLTQRNNKKALYYLMNAIGKMYTSGLEPQIENLYPPVSFPVARGTPGLHPLVTWDHSEKWSYGCCMAKSTILPAERVFEINLNYDDLFLCFKLHEQYTIPPSAFLSYVWETQRLINGDELQNATVVFENVRFIKDVSISKKSSLSLFLLYQRGSGDFEFYLSQELICKGRLNLWEGNAESLSIKREVAATNEMHSNLNLTSDEIYQVLESSGHSIEKQWHSIVKQSFYDDEWCGSILWEDNWILFLDALLKLSILNEIENGGKMVRLSDIQQLVINPAVFDKCLKNFDTYYQLTTETIRCEGILIHQAKTSNLEQAVLPISTLKLEYPDFLPTSNLDFKTEEEFVGFCFQTMIDCCYKSKRFNERLRVTVLELQDEEPNLKSFLPVIEDILQQHSNVETDFKLISMSDENEDLYSDKDSDSCHLILTSEQNYRLAFSTLIHKRNGFVIIRLSSNEFFPIFASSNFLQIARNCSSPEKLILYRLAEKICDTFEESSSVFAWSHADWIHETQTKLVEANDKGTQVFLIADRQPDVGIPLFLKEMNKLQFSLLLRFVFILDKTAPFFSLDNFFYQKELQKDLPVNIYANGCWNFFQKIILKDSIHHSYLEKEPTTNLTLSMLDDISVHYLGINPQHFDLDCKKLELGPYEYSGITPEGKSIMGIAQLPETSVKLKPESRLFWQIPEHWTLEDAATVPLLYTLAYYSLHIIGEITKKQKVLIHAGHTLIGQVAIAVALSMDTFVYSTVPNVEAREHLKQVFPNFPDENIFDFSDPDWELKLILACKGKGVNIVINSLSGDKTFAAIRCIGKDGKFVQISTTDFYNKEQLGMFCFLKALSYFGVGVDKIFNLHTKDKERLWALVNDGIETGVVKPLKRKTLSGPCTGEEALNVLKDSNEGYDFSKVVLALRGEQKKNYLNYKESKEKYYCDPNKMYLIIGGKSGVWLDLAEWLIARGARRLTAAVEKHAMASSTARKFNLLLARYPSVTIQMESAHKANSEFESAHLLREITVTAPLGAVFFFRINKSSNKIKNIHEALQALSMDTMFISLLSGGVEECNLRKKNNQTSLCLLPDNNVPIKTSRVLSILDSLLIKVSNKLNESVIILSEEQLSRDLGSEINALYLSWFLPSSVNDLFVFRNNLVDTPVFEEVRTHSPKLKNTKGVLPVFIIPGLNPTCLKTLSSNLQYPAFVAKLPLKIQSIEETAKHLVKSMKDISDCASSTLIGDSWGGVLTLHIASILESQGKHVIVFLLEAAPETSLNWVHSLFSDGPSPKKLISRYWSLTNEMKSMFSSETNLEKQLDLFFLNEPEPRKQLLAESIFGLHSLSMSLLKYKASVAKMKCKLVLFKCKGAVDCDSCGLSELCHNKILIFVSDESDYEKMLSSSSTASVINDEAAIDYLNKDNIDVIMRFGTAVDKNKGAFK